MTTLNFEPLVPGALWLALAAVGVALLAWYALRRPPVVSRGRWAGVVALMTVAIALVLGVLLNPTWVREIPPPAGKPLLTVVVDASGSMATPDGGPTVGTSRYEAAVKTAASLADELGDRFDIRVRAFTDQSATTDAKALAKAKPEGAATDLSAAMAEALAEERAQGQAVVVLSDGIQTVGGSQQVLETVRRAKALAAPVYTRTLGSAVRGIDLAVDVRSPQDLAFVGQRVPVTVRVGGRGLVRGAKATVTLLADGVEVGREEATLGGPATPEVRFWVRQDKTGLFPYEARVEPVPGEATQANNSSTYLLRVIDQPVRALLLEGKPYWDSKFLVRTLGDIPAVELDSVVRLSPTRLIHRTTARSDPQTQPAGAVEVPTPDLIAAAPADEVSLVAAAANDGPAAAPAKRPEGATVAADGKPSATAPGGSAAARSESWKIVSDAGQALADPQRLKQYQVIVLGREAEAFLTDAAVANLQAWVSRDGGALVCARGSPTAQVNQRLARMLPVSWTPTREARFRLRLTDQGRDMQWLGGGSGDDAGLAGLPTLASSAQVDKSKPLAVVLATAVAPEGGVEAPAVVYQPYGSGRVVVIEGAGMWRWAFLPPAYQQKDEVYGSLWQSVMRWISSGSGLLPGQRLALRADKVNFPTEEPATATLLVREEAAAGKAPTVELTGPGEATKSFSPTPMGEEPGTFRVNFGQLPPGRYQAKVTGAGPQDVAAKSVFDVKVVGREQLDLDPRPDLMARVATDSGGAVLAGDAAGDVAKAFKEHMARTRPPRYDRATAWDKPWVLIAVFGIWAASWALRRNTGLV